MRSTRVKGTLLLYCGMSVECENSLISHTKDGV